VLGCVGGFFVSDTAQVKLRSGRVKATWVQADIDAFQHQMLDPALAPALSSPEWDVFTGGGPRSTCLGRFASIRSPRLGGFATIRSTRLCRFATICSPCLGRFASIRSTRLGCFANVVNHSTQLRRHMCCFWAGAHPVGGEPIQAAADRAPGRGGADDRPARRGGVLQVETRVQTMLNAPGFIA